MTEYQLGNDKLAALMSSLFSKMLDEGNAYEAFLGKEAEFRFTCKDSFLMSVTDNWVLLNYCIYPLSLKNRTDIEKIIYGIFDRLYDEIVDVYLIHQTLSFIFEQELLKEDFTNLPVIFDLEKYVPRIAELMNQNETILKDFEIDGINMYEPMKNMLKKIR